MSNDKTPVTPSKPGMGDLLSSLATGDNFSKLLMVVVILLTGGGIWNTKHEGAATRSELSHDFLEAQKKARKQVHAIYDNQTAFIKALKAERDDHNKLMMKFGLGPSMIKDIPIEELPNDEENK